MHPLPLVRRVRERRDAAEHRQQVLDAARRLFAERGVESVTMDEIAHAAGVGKGTLYRRYTDKGQLVLAVMDSCVGTLQVRLAAVLDPPAAERSAASGLERLTAVLTLLANWIEEHGPQLGVIAHQPAGESSTALHCSSMYGWMHSVVVDLLTAAVAAGESNVADPVYCADALLATLDIDLYLFQRNERKYTTAQIHAGLQQLVDGLRATSPHVSQTR